jgi:lipoate-protein ligase A
MNWRIIYEDQVDAAYGLAADEHLADSVGELKSPPTLRLYTYKSTCALCGRFQNIRNEIDIGFCEANGISLNRRPTGGGSIIMGKDQLGIALVIPGKEGDN